MNLPGSRHALRYLESEQGRDTPLHIAVALASIDWDGLLKGCAVKLKDLHSTRQTMEGIHRRHSGGQS